jgi:hypothetical protein
VTGLRRFARDRSRDGADALRPSHTYRKIFAAPVDNNRLRNLVQHGLRCRQIGYAEALLDGLALAIALFQKTQVVLDIFVGGILALGGHKRRMRAFVVAAQHI